MTAPEKPGLSNEELKPEVQAALSGGGDERWEKEAPVAPVRKWEAEDVVGEIVFHESSSVLGDDGERSIDVRFEELSPEVQDALNGRKA